MTELLLRAAPLLLNGIGVTAMLSAASIGLGTLWGFACGLVRVARFPLAAGAIAAYVHVVRGTPFVVQLYIIYFVLPRLGVKLDAWSASIAALSLYAGAYVTEITRAAIESVPKEQSEAAEALGMSFWQCSTLVILPQALRVAVPPLAGLAVVMVKNTSVVSIVGISELLRAGENLSLVQPAHLLAINIAVALLYLVLCWPLLRLSQRLEAVGLRSRNGPAFGIDSAAA